MLLGYYSGESSTIQFLELSSILCSLEAGISTFFCVAQIRLPRFRRAWSLHLSG